MIYERDTEKAKRRQHFEQTLFKFQRFYIWNKTPKVTLLCNATRARKAISISIFEYSIFSALTMLQLVSLSLKYSLSMLLLKR